MLEFYPNHHHHSHFHHHTLIKDESSKLSPVVDCVEKGIWRRKLKFYFNLNCRQCTRRVVWILILIEWWPLKHFLLLYFYPENIIKCEKNYEICEGCGHKIYDRYLMRVENQTYHEHCLKCAVCTSNLSHSCYSRNTKLYCKADYDR